MTAIDPVQLTQALIRKPSVTPADAGAMDVLQQALTELGFVCRRMRFGEIENLYARFGEQGPNLCFAGHTDVVPVGDAAAWTKGAFEGAIEDGMVIGRGAVDMKGAIACMVAACQRAMATLMRGRTSFVIAHRLSTIRDAHTILVMDRGRIVETGTHETLLARRGFYAELYESQFGEALDEAV